MTQNQIAYQANLEKERSNRANELLKSSEIDVSQLNAQTNKENMLVNARQAAGQLQRWAAQSQIEATSAGGSVMGGLGRLVGGLASLAGVLAAL